MTEEILSGKTVLLGVSGGIAAYKSAMLASRLVKLGADVHVIMTANATEFVGVHTFESLTGNRVCTDTFDRLYERKTEHIALADAADLLLIAPATANVLAKCARGIADDMLTTVTLACTCPKMAAPAMNTKMYENQVTQDNLSLLRGYGWEILEPGAGWLACGATGKGRMPEPDDLVDAVLLAIGHEKDMQGLKVLVTAGPTRESLDPVRFISNHSTGTMGYAIARAAAIRGASVTLVSGPTSLDCPAGVERIDIQSAKDMYEAVTSAFPACDIIVKAAAVADWRPARVSSQKIKKTDDGAPMVLELERTDDILASISGQRRPGQFICGFSMETTDVLENSRKKLEKKGLDMIAANSVSESGSGFGTGTNHIVLITKETQTDIPLMSKEKAAFRLLDEILKIRG